MSEELNTEETSQEAESQEIDIQESEPEQTEESVKITLTPEELADKIKRAEKKAKAIAERKTRQKLEREYSQQYSEPVTQERPPKRSDFATEDEFFDARFEFQDRLRAVDDAKTRAQREFEQIIEKTDRILEEAEELPEFDRDIFDSLPLTESIARALVDSDDAVKILAYMTSNPDDVERISKLSPARQAAEIGKLELKLNTVKKPASKPVAPTSGSSSVSLFDKNPDSLSDDEYYKERQRRRG